jgi:hypothetical protein
MASDMYELEVEPVHIAAQFAVEQIMSETSVVLNAKQ